MQYSELRTATLRTAFAGVYVANIVAACLHFGAGYLDVLASLIIIVFAACMLMVTLQVPEKFMVYMEMTNREIVFSWRFRMIADVVQILFLVSQGVLGDVMAIVTGLCTFGAFTLAQKRPDIFRELFRKHAGDPEMGGDGESEYQEAA